MLVFPSLNPKPFTPFTPIPIPSTLKLSSTQANLLPSTTCTPYSTEANLSRPCASTSTSLSLNLSRQLNSLPSSITTGNQRTPTTTTMRHPTSLIISLHMTMYTQILIPATIPQNSTDTTKTLVYTSVTPIPHPSKPELNFDRSPASPPSRKSSSEPSYHIGCILFFPTMHNPPHGDLAHDLEISSWPVVPCFSSEFRPTKPPLPTGNLCAFCSIRRRIFCANFSAAQGKNFPNVFPVY